MKLLLVAALFPFAALAQAPVIEISGANYRPMPVAVAIPLTQDEGAKGKLAEFDDALTFDLKGCGLFTLLDRKSFLADAKEGITAGSINFPNWTNVGADALVKTQISSDGEQLRGDLRLFTVSSGREELKASESVSGKDPRKLAHKLANAVYKFFTRETGPFESKITWVKKTPGALRPSDKKASRKSSISCAQNS